MWHRLGSTIAPPRFLLFCLLLPAVTITATHWLGVGRAVLVGFDVSGTIFLLSLTPLLRHGEAARMRAASQRNDANRAMLLAITGAVMAVILVAVAKELQGKDDPLAIALVVATLALAWLFSNTIYALHYAHLYYADDDGQPGDDGGIDFPNCDEPDYWDFVYFSFTLGMTFQTSDVEVTARRIRRVVIGHCLLGFVFNLGVIAFTINVIGGSGGGG